MEDNTEATKASPERKTLVSIQIEKELDILDGKAGWEHRVFVKLYVAARTSGLLAEISDRDWKTLCTLATFMDEDGVCYPSQEQLARALQIHRATANDRIQSLAGFRFKGRPVLLISKRRSQGRRFAANLYTILPISELKIFDRKQQND
ncbi:MAG: helix-turn-helix domain-containing protein [Proteobacteria bacterium]|nr:helix-turn-helix domain-containing protein [Pseudomonadota bacterium]